MLSDWGLSQVFNIRYLSSSFERRCKQEGRENAQFYFWDFGKCWKPAVLWIVASPYKVVLRTAYSGRCSFMFLLPVVLKQLRLHFNREQAVRVAHNMHGGLKLMCIVYKDLHCVVPSSGKTGGINHGGTYGTFTAWLCWMPKPAPDVPAALVSLGDLPFIRLIWVDLTSACSPVARKQNNWLSSRC